MNIDLNFMQFNADVSKEFMEICKAHPGCIDCPLKISDKEINGSKVRCNTGRGDIK